MNVSLKKNFFRNFITIFITFVISFFIYSYVQWDLSKGALISSQKIDWSKIHRNIYSSLNSTIRGTDILQKLNYNNISVNDFENVNSLNKEIDKKINHQKNKSSDEKISEQEKIYLESVFNKKERENKVSIFKMELSHYCQRDFQFIINISVGLFLLSSIMVCIFSNSLKDAFLFEINSIKSFLVSYILSNTLILSIYTSITPSISEEQLKLLFSIILYTLFATFIYFFNDLIKSLTKFDAIIKFAKEIKNNPKKIINNIWSIRCSSNK
ncbi:hypothetical protein [Fructilactobacillus frigidiflavus]|uniref:hypothetical protein n=1 Tax=Fructilactobacillus frigidiflavus TaxID=3242688 RepID=UPI003757D335